MEAFIRSGGDLLTGAEVERIVVEGNRATGVELADGRTLRARQFVASTVDVPQTFGRFVGLDQVPPAYREKVEAFKQTAWTLFGLHVALDEPPRHVGTDFDPHVNESLKVNVGCESLEQLFALHDEVAEGQGPVTGLVRHRGDHPVRPVSGAGRQGHRVRLARHALRARRRPRKHRGRQRGLRRPDARYLAASTRRT